MSDAAFTIMSSRCWESQHTRIGRALGRAHVALQVVAVAGGGGSRRRSLERGNGCALSGRVASLALLAVVWDGRDVASFSAAAIIARVLVDIIVPGTAAASRTA